MKESPYTEKAEVYLKIFVPKGASAGYVEPVSSNGSIYIGEKTGFDINWNGIMKALRLSDEMEILLQRGRSYTVRKMYYEPNGRLYIELDLHPEDGYNLFGQDDPIDRKPTIKKGR
ncbi:MAG: hypothetical protein J6332_03820 [Abditibacteriota bacterium]|nr:hypothetical protein [Abditibacteriota bacterium]